MTINELLEQQALMGTWDICSAITCEWYFTVDANTGDVLDCDRDADPHFTCVVGKVISVTSDGVLYVDDSMSPTI